jgi:hypothetical protein
MVKSGLHTHTIIGQVVFLSSCGMDVTKSELAYSLSPLARSLLL